MDWKIRTRVLRKRRSGSSSILSTSRPKASRRRRQVASYLSSSRSKNSISWTARGKTFGMRKIHLPILRNRLVSRERVRKTSTSCSSPHPRRKGASSSILMPKSTSGNSWRKRLSLRATSRGSEPSTTSYQRRITTIDSLMEDVSRLRVWTRTWMWSCLEQATPRKEVLQAFRLCPCSLRKMIIDETDLTTTS